jgi:cyclase
MRCLRPTTLLFSALLGAAPAVAEGPAPASGIASERVADGVWAAPTPGGANVGWFRLGEEVVAVDSGLTEEVGRAILDEIQKTAGRKPRYVIVTHVHRDHAGGVAAFAAAGAQVIAAEKAAPPVLALLQSPPAGGARSDSPSGPRRTPVLTLADRILFVGGSRRVEIYYLGPAHTRGDLIVVLPDDGVLFPGDLAGNGVLPYMHSADVDPKGWEQALARLAALKIQKMVPGHGAIGPTEGIGQTLAYVRKVDEIATRLLVANVSSDLIEAQLRSPENRIENLPVTPEHIANVKAALEFLKAERAKPMPPPPPTRAPAPR